MYIDTVRDGVVIFAERCEKMRIVSSGDRETLRVMKILGRFEAGVNRTFCAVFPGYEIFGLFRNVSRFGLFETAGNLQFFLGDFLFALVEKLLKESVDVDSFFLKFEEALSDFGGELEGI